MTARSIPGSHRRLLLFFCVVLAIVVAYLIWFVIQEKNDPRNKYIGTYGNLFSPNAVPVGDSAIKVYKGRKGTLCLDVMGAYYLGNDLCGKLSGSRLDFEVLDLAWKEVTCRLQFDFTLDSMILMSRSTGCRGFDHVYSGVYFRDYEIELPFEVEDIHEQSGLEAALNYANAVRRAINRSRLNPAEYEKNEPVSLPAGSFTLISRGESNLDLNLESDNPPNPYYLTRAAKVVAVSAFHLDSAEATVERYNEFAREYGMRVYSPPLSKTSDYDYGAKDSAALLLHEALAYCRSLGGRLPTSEEYLYAATYAGKFAHSVDLPLGELVLSNRFSPFMASDDCVGLFVLPVPMLNSMGFRDLLGGRREWVSVKGQSFDLTQVFHYHNPNFGFLVFDERGQSDDTFSYEGIRSPREEKAQRIRGGCRCAYDRGVRGKS